MQKGYVTIPTGQIHYRMKNPRSGIPLLLLHQTPSSSIMFEALADSLDDTFWLIAPDTPGFGQSDPLMGEISIENYAHTIYQAIGTLGIKSCWLFGHHTGAAIAVALAYRYPDFVDNLILSGPPLLDKKQIKKLKTTLTSTNLDDEGQFILDLWQRIGKKDQTVSLDLRMRETNLALLAGDHYQAAYQAVFNHKFQEQLSSIQCPTLVMAGERDSLYDSLQPSYELLANGTVRSLADCGSYVIDQQPDLVAGIIQNFLGD